MSVVVVTWILVLLALFGANQTHDAIVDADAVRHGIERHRVRACARSALEYASQVLASTPRDSRHRLAHAGSHNPLTGIHRCGEGSFAIGVRHGRGDDEVWTTGIEGTGARLPIAIADSAGLASLPGMSDHGVRTLLGARRTANGRRVAPFDTLPLDPPSRSCVATYVTRHGGAVDLNTASAPVLRALGVPRGAVDAILEWRAGADHVTGTEDDRAWSSLDELTRGESCRLNAEEAAALAWLRAADRVTVHSDFFRVHARGWIGEGRGICEIEAVLEITDGGSVHVVERAEHWRR